MIRRTQLPARFLTLISEEEVRFHEPKVIDVSAAIPDTGAIPLLDQNRWLRVPDVICVYVDMINSTQLSASHHDKTTAAIFQLFVATAIRVFDECESPYIDVKGDGVFALFNAGQVHRALAAAVVFKTFADEVFVPSARTLSDVSLGTHCGIDQRTVLVRKIGLKRVAGRTDRQNEVWAGKTVNMAAKLASRTDGGQILVSERFFQRLADSKALRSCGCPNGVVENLWSPVDLSMDEIFDFDKAYRLGSIWCATHGAEYCDALIKADQAE